MTLSPAEHGTADAIVTFGEPLAAALPVEPEPLYQSPVLRLYAGGAELNFAIGMRRLGFAASLVGHVGDDPPGRYVRRILDAEGVDISHLGTRPEPTGLYLREWLPDGVRRPYYYRTGSAGSSFTAADWPDDLTGARWLHLTGVTPALSQDCRDATFTAAAWARKTGIPVSFDPNYRPRLWDMQMARPVLLDLIRLCDVLLIGLDEATALFGATDVTEAAIAVADLGPGLVIVKSGAAGASAWNDGRLVHQPAHASAATDPVGAGDAFNAGCVASLLHGSSLADALAVGAYCGARVAETPGEHAGFPYRAALPAPLRLAIE